LTLFSDKNPGAELWYCIIQMLTRKPIGEVTTGAQNLCCKNAYVPLVEEFVIGNLGGNLGRIQSRSDQL